MDQTVKAIEHDLYSILTDSTDTPELYASLDEADAMPSSVSSGLLCLIGTISDNSQPQLTLSIKCHKL